MKITTMTCQIRRVTRRGGEFPLSFLENWKKVSGFWENIPGCDHRWFKFITSNVIFKFFYEEKPIFFLQSISFFCCRSNFDRSALVSRKLHWGDDSTHSLIPDTLEKVPTHVTTQLSLLFVRIFIALLFISDQSAPCFPLYVAKGQFPFLGYPLRLQVLWLSFMCQPSQHFHVGSTLFQRCGSTLK